MIVAALTSPIFAMWAVFAIIALAMVLYATEWVALEVVSLGALVALMLLAALVPVTNLYPGAILAGFANPALITVLALMVVGQGLVQTEALAGISNQLARLWPKHPILVVIVALLFAGAASSILNNTPVVVVFMPLLASILARRRIPASRYMMSLSYITILGGMVTVIGSSTNLLAAGVARQEGVESVTFFSFAVPGLAMAMAGAFYVLFVVPRILPDNSPAMAGPSGRGTQFVTEIQLTPGHPLIGEQTVAGMFPKLTAMTVRAVHRGRTNFLPPFDDITLITGDTLILAATRDNLTDALKTWWSHDVAGPMGGDNGGKPSGVVLCEALVSPGSRLINTALDQAAFMAEHDCLILGIERRSRMPRQPIREIRLEAGDVLLLASWPGALERMRGLQDLLVIEWSAREIRPHKVARRALAIFAATILTIATGLLPTVTAAVAGAFAMLASGSLNPRQAARAIDRRIVLMVGAALAMATAMHATGGANALAAAALGVLGTGSPALVMASLFGVVALVTNILSNNTAAVLFTPVAIAAAGQLGIAPLPLIASVILGANASFASPIGYQTNLLVMGAGHYRFRDFLIAGGPLVVIVFATFCIVAPWWYGV